jgi:predicted transcriptional regulator
MRITITLDPDVDARIRKLMRERKLSLKEAVNATLRAGLAPASAGESFRTPTYDMGSARLPLDRALALAGKLEDDELLRKRSVGK